MREARERLGDWWALCSGAVVAAYDFPPSFVGSHAFAIVASFTTAYSAAHLAANSSTFFSAHYYAHSRAHPHAYSVANI